MTDTPAEEDLAGARAYEELHVNSLFQPWAPVVADKAGIKPGHAVLDVACGTGVVARAAVERVGTDGSVTGVDLNPAMVAVATELAPSATFHVAPADALPFDDHTFDAVTCQFALMFFPDRVAAIREMLRVLRPGGHLAVAVWESLENTAVYPEAVALLEEMAGTAAADALRAPFVLGDRGELRDLFTKAGSAGVTVDTLTLQADFPSIRSLVEADLRGWLPVMGVTVDEDTIASILAAAEDVLGEYRTTDGRAVFDAPGHVVSCTTS